jgi:hypothetical protein
LNPVRVTTFVSGKVICEFCNINFYTILNYIVGLRGYYSSEKNKISFKMDDINIFCCGFIISYIYLPQQIIGK